MEAELKIELLGSPVLRQRAAEVERIDDEVRELVRCMFSSMYTENGQGLAAPQVGVLRRIIVLDVPNGDATPHALVNPRIVERSSDTARGQEGCLSIPGVQDVVERPERVVVEGLDIDGSAVRLDADGELARCLQHEIDHLDGVLFIDHLSPLKRRMLLAKYRKGRLVG